MSVQLTSEQCAAIEDRGGDLLVSAAAGSGKTRVLVERLLSYVEAGYDIDRFLVITYTKAAAAELRGRISSELADRIAQKPGDAFLRRQATLVYQAQISTVHAFCAQFLREEGYRLDLDRDFRLCDENESRILLSEVLNTVLDRRYETIEKDADFAFLVDTMSAGRDDSKLIDIVLDIRERIQSHPDPMGWLDAQERVFALSGVTDVGTTSWGELLLADVRRQCDYWAGRLEEALELTRGDNALSRGYAPALGVALSRIRLLSLAAKESWDAAVHAWDSVEFPRLGPVRKCEDLQAREYIKLLWDNCKKRIRKLEEWFQDDSEGLLEDMRAVYPAIRGLFALVRDFEAAYAAEKRRRSWLDFSDLEHLTANLLSDTYQDVSEERDDLPTELARRWGERFDEIMVDEYQDTNAVQNAIFTALTRFRHNLFMVGDVKQSIYRFRLADPTIFLAKYKAFRPSGEAGQGEPRRILLSRNFRSRPQVLEGCNYLFRSVMSVEFGEMDYTDDEALVPGGNIPGEDERNRVELNLLDCSLAGGDDEESGPRPPRDLLEARWIAKRIRELLDEGFPVDNGEGGFRPVRPGDVVVLLRSPGTVLRHYAAALAERNIPWEADGGGDFFAAAEVQVALALLQMIDNPRQDVPLIAVLRSPAYAFSADRLAEIRANAPSEDFYNALTRDRGEDAAYFLAELNELRRRAGDESCERLLWQVYDRTNLLGVYGAMEEGETRRANLLLLAQMAREYEQAGHRGLFDFLRYLHRLEESGGKPPLPKTGAAGGGVKILSIHKSKGLEFPVVVLAGLSRQINQTDMSRPVLFHSELGVGPRRLDLERMVEYPTLARLAVARQMERELRSEELRLLYVAMTRAKEKLILSCALGGGRRDVEKLLPSVGCPVEPQALMERQSPAQWVLLAALARPEAGSFREGSLSPPIDPAIYFGPAWDMRWVDAAPLTEAPVPMTEVRETAEGAGEADPELVSRFRWSYPHAGDVELPSKLTVTQMKGRNLDEEAAGDAERREPSPPVYRFDRPRFAAEKLGLTAAQKGVALHLVMQYIDFARCDSRAHVAEEIDRLVAEAFLTPQQGEAADPESIRAFFASPLGRELLEAPLLQREFKFSVLVPAGRYYPQAGEGEQILLQGVVDCYFETLEGITVVDFKTDRVYGQALEDRALAYRPQLAAYADALSEITGKPVRRRVLWFFSEGRAVEV